MDVNFLKKRVAEFLKLKKPSRIVITRMVGQSVLIGDAYVTLIMCRGGRARLAIIADRDMVVERFDEFCSSESQGAVNGQIKDEQTKRDPALG